MKAGRALANALAFAALTALTQTGGLAWLVALRFRRRWVAFAAFYALIWGFTLIVAPLAGRVQIGCSPFDTITTKPLLCAMNRSYGTPALKAVLNDLAKALAQGKPQAQLVLLDAGFPFFDGFALLPHLSHDDGEKADIALFYDNASGAYLPGRTRAPLGYFAFEPGKSDCPARFPTLRWDLAWLQPAFPNWRLDEARTARALSLLAADPRVGRVFIEPHLRARLGVSSPKIGFQGCRAARHDDHIHLQL